jgi:hypothetical protein
MSATSAPAPATARTVPAPPPARRNGGAATSVAGTARAADTAITLQEISGSLKAVLAGQIRLENRILALEKKVEALLPALPIIASLDRYLQQAKKTAVEQHSVRLRLCAV